MALAETKHEGHATKTATNAQVSGMLNLKDPRPEIITRRWSYFAALTFQNFQSQGFATKEGTGTFDLGKNERTVMPGIELGLVTPSLPTKALLWQLGLRGKAGFASQETSVALDSGYRIDDARLNTTLLSAGPALSLQWERLNWLSLNVSPQYGTLSYTQTSSNDFATFSKSAAFEALSYGLDIRMNRKWSIFSEWSQRKIKDNTQIALQKDNFELGTKLTW